MLRFILLSSILSSSLTFSAAISCTDGTPEGARFTIITSTKVLDSDKAVYVEEMDVDQEYPRLLGLYSRSVNKDGVDLTFAEASQIDWSSIPKKNCFVRHGDFYILTNLKRGDKGAAGDYIANFGAAMRVAIRPGEEKTCPTPKPLIKPPKPVSCSEVRVHFD